MRKCYIFLLVGLWLQAESKTWFVGPLSNFKVPSAVASLVNDGDSVWIEAGEYTKDVCLWKANNLFISGNGGYAKLNAERTAYGGKAIWVISGNNMRVEFIEFSNCEVVDRNGAGIRLEGKNLVVRHCYFHHNQNGILAGNNPESDVLIEHSEFSTNGAGDGFSHNIYINHLRSLTIRYSYFHHAYYGHEIKTRADRNVILYNRITNEEGDASYEIDIPNGGPSLVMGNVIQQSKFSDNNTIISYGREGLTNTGPHNFYFIHNTVVNNEDKGILFNIQSKTDTLLSINNIISGKLTILSGIPNTTIQSNNVVRMNIVDMAFKDPANYNYYLTSISPGIDSGIIINNAFLGYELMADKEYLHPVDWKSRYNDQIPDVGAHENQQITKSRDEKTNKRSFVWFYDAFTEQLYLNAKESGPVETSVNLLDLHGNLRSQQQFNGELTISLNGMPVGIYLLSILQNNKVITQKFVKSN
ncbi:MAG: right-handed parallel beta-helix repeat-containing protein [Saprospiraceae bacterium]|nr:right-handed parallel beta-helix repeat-containing protein [Saprospiraceae bacterium]